MPLQKLPPKNGDKFRPGANSKWRFILFSARFFYRPYLVTVSRKYLPIYFTSAGFYDLSDGGSCSLSNSCTSVYSESISSSHTSLLPSSQHPKARLSVFDYRPKSADETTVHTTSFQQQDTYASDGCRITASTDVSGTPARSRPRPVSTGNWLQSWVLIQEKGRVLAITLRTLYTNSVINT